jgi:hypothetical protein
VPFNCFTATFDSISYTAEVPEDVHLGYSVVNVKATDLDSGKFLSHATLP